MRTQVAALVVVMSALTLLAPPAPVAAQPRSATAPELHNGFSVERLARIDSFFDDLVAAGGIAGGVALVLRDGQPVYERAFGYADLPAQRRMTTDAIFRIASQTKAITSVAIMMLAEEGRLGINDQVGRYLPEFRSTTVSTQTDSGRFNLPAARQITIRDLLTHTSGISYGTAAAVAQAYREIGLGPVAGPSGWYLADKDEPVCETMARLPSVPFMAQPGERFVYGYSTDVLGCVVERASGMPLDRFVETRITQPLGMRDTHFFLPESKAQRLAAVHTRRDGVVELAAAGAAGQGHYLEGPRRSFAGGAGLLSTARDYSRFMQMLLNGGELDGVRILAPSSVALMTANHIGSLYSQQGEGFGLGFRILLQPGARGRVESVGAYGWGGAYGSTYDIDPAEGLVLLYMVQELPNFSGLAGRFPMLVYQALVQPRTFRPTGATGRPPT
jgi:CubicO group peptidase (beta-lactamase class C family)